MQHGVETGLYRRQVVLNVVRHAQHVVTLDAVLFIQQQVRRAQGRLFLPELERDGAGHIDGDIQRAGESRRYAQQVYEIGPPAAGSREGHAVMRPRPGIFQAGHQQEKEDRESRLQVACAPGKQDARYYHVKDEVIRERVLHAAREMQQRRQAQQVHGDLGVGEAVGDRRRGRAGRRPEPG